MSITFGGTDRSPVYRTMNIHVKVDLVYYQDFQLYDLNAQQK